MNHQKSNQPDFGTGKKKLGIYMAGLMACIVLTLIAFGTVMVNKFPKQEIITIIFSAAIMQFLVQLLCFLRLNTQTEQGKINVMSFVFTGVILVTIIAGSLWIMWNCNYYMSH
jgi:cytochrome o ubiquinol oxidase operon protein cyoD